MYYWTPPELLRPALTRAPLGTRLQTTCVDRVPVGTLSPWPPTPHPRQRLTAPRHPATSSPRSTSAALAALLDGKYAEIRGLVRTNLAEYASILEEAETMSRDEFRERVKEVVVEMAVDRPDRHGLPGGVRRRRRHRRVGRGLRDAGVRRPVGAGEGRRAVRAVRRRDPPARHRASTTTPTSPDLITGKLMGCFAMTETGHGSNVQALGTVGDVRRGDAGVRHHRRTASRPARTTSATPRSTPRSRWSSPSSRWAAPPRACTRSSSRSARTGEPCPGVRIEDDGAKMGLNGVDNGRLWFDGVRVPRDGAAQPVRRRHPGGGLRERDREPQPALLHHARHPRPGPGLRRRRGDQRRQGRADHRGRSTPLRRRQFEASSEERGGAAPRLRHAPAPAAPAAGPHLRAALRPGGRGRPAARRLLGRSTDDDEHARRELESRAAGTKALGTWHATRTIQECREACGGAGYLSVNRFAALKADTDVFTTFEGDNHVLLQLVAKGLLTDYASEFEDMDQFGMVRFVAGMAVETVIEKTNVHKLLERIKDVLPGGDEWDQEAGLLDPDYQLAMLRFREEHMLAGVARRLKRGIDQKMNPGVVFSRVQDHVIAAATRARRAAGARGVRRRRRARCPTGDLKVALNLLCDLHALTHDRGGPGLVHGARPAHGACGPRRSAARSTACAARSARWPGTSSTRSAYPRRCCARRT